MAESTKHNGWTNYATWRVNLEQVSDLPSDYWADYIEDNRGSDLLVYDLGQQIKSYVEEMISMQVTPLKNNIAENYAHAFISEVNWREIAEHIYNEYVENNWCDNCNDKIDCTYMQSFCSEKCKNEYNMLADHEKG